MGRITEEILDHMRELNTKHFWYLFIDSKKRLSKQFPNIVTIEPDIRRKAKAEWLRKILSTRLGISSIDTSNEFLKGFLIGLDLSPIEKNLAIY
ncbi:hypothetical protein ACFL0U_01460 [Pseudomonadota bacterium]